MAGAPTWPAGAANTYPTLTFIPNSTVNISWPAANGDGYPVSGYTVIWATSPGSWANTLYTTDQNITVGGFVEGTTWYFRVMPSSVGGQGATTQNAIITIPTQPPPAVVPSAPSVLALTGTVPSTVSAAFDVPWDGGSPLIFFEIEYSPNSYFSNAISIGLDNPVITVNDVTPGVITYFRGRAYNAVGIGPWSVASSIQLLSGPKVRYSGVYRTTVAYVKYQGVWRVVVPYVKHQGVWRVAGG